VRGGRQKGVATPAEQHPDAGSSCARASDSETGTRVAKLAAFVLASQAAACQAYSESPLIFSTLRVAQQQLPFS